MSTIRPPLTTSMTWPVTVPPWRMISSMRPQARSYWARFLDRISRPSWSSTWSTRASILSPTWTTSLGLTLLRMESSAIGMIPSDLKPMSTSTSSGSTRTTVPLTRLPSENSTTVRSTAAAKSSADRRPNGMSSAMVAATTGAAAGASAAQGASTAAAPQQEAPQQGQRPGSPRQAPRRAPASWRESPPPEGRWRPRRRSQSPSTARPRRCRERARR